MHNERFNRTVRAGLTAQYRTNFLGQAALRLMFVLFVLLVAFDLSGIVATAWLGLNPESVHWIALIAVGVLFVLFRLNSKRA